MLCFLDLNCLVVYEKSILKQKHATKKFVKVPKTREINGDIFVWCLERLWHVWHWVIVWSFNEIHTFFYLFILLFFRCFVLLWVVVVVNKHSWHCLFFFRSGFFFLKICCFCFCFLCNLLDWSQQLGDRESEGKIVSATVLPALTAVVCVTPLTRVCLSGYEDLSFWLWCWRPHLLGTLSSLFLNLFPSFSFFLPLFFFFLFCFYLHLCFIRVKHASSSRLICRGQKRDKRKREKWNGREKEGERVRLYYCLALL